MQNIIKIIKVGDCNYFIKPLWATMKRKGITTYTLLKQYSFSRGTLDSLKQGRNISTATLNDLCNMLDCRVEDVWLYIPDE